MGPGETEPKKHKRLVMALCSPVIEHHLTEFLQNPHAQLSVLPRTLCFLSMI